METASDTLCEFGRPDTIDDELERALLCADKQRDGKYPISCCEPSGAKVEKSVAVSKLERV